MKLTGSTFAWVLAIGVGVTGLGATAGPCGELTPGTARMPTGRVLPGETRCLHRNVQIENRRLQTDVVTPDVTQLDRPAAIELVQGRTRLVSAPAQAHFAGWRRALVPPQVRFASGPPRCPTGRRIVLPMAVRWQDAVKAADRVTIRRTPGAGVAVLNRFVFRRDKTDLRPQPIRAVPAGEFLESVSLR